MLTIIRAIDQLKPAHWDAAECEACGEHAATIPVLFPGELHPEVVTLVQFSAACEDAGIETPLEWRRKQ